MWETKEMQHEETQSLYFDVQCEIATCSSRERGPLGACAIPTAPHG